MCIELTYVSCKDCVNGFLGQCNYSYHSAACLTTAKPWRDEPLDKLLDYINKVRDFERGRFEERMRTLEAKELEIKQSKNGVKADV